MLPLARVKTKLAPAYAALETALEKALSNAAPITPRNTPQVTAALTFPVLAHCLLLKAMHCLVSISSISALGTLIQQIWLCLC